MKNTIDLLSVKKIRVTPQRLAVFDVFGPDLHFTAESIYKKLKKQFPSISFATVYTILQMFKNRGIISESRIDFERSTFESRTDCHHHFMCKSCSKIYDIDIPPCNTLKTLKVKGFRIEDFQGYFYGTCRECVKNA
ncbi:MAG: Fur family transcriptional regulator [Candidatus Omnitrophica bacterium]|nr:Fur family transcriptional regulator [Candidatus Omnitrophota bacterium]